MGVVRSEISRLGRIEEARVRREQKAEAKRARAAAAAAADAAAARDAAVARDAASDDVGAAENAVAAPAAAGTPRVGAEYVEATGDDAATEASTAAAAAPATPAPSAEHDSAAAGSAGSAGLERARVADGAEDNDDEEEEDGGGLFSIFNCGSDASPATATPPAPPSAAATPSAYTERNKVVAVLSGWTGASPVALLLARTKKAKAARPRYLRSAGTGRGVHAWSVYVPFSASLAKRASTATARRLQPEGSFMAKHWCFSMAPLPVDVTGASAAETADGDARAATGGARNGGAPAVWCATQVRSFFCLLNSSFLLLLIFFLCTLFCGVRRSRRRTTCARASRSSSSFRDSLSRKGSHHRCERCGSRGLLPPRSALPLRRAKPPQCTKRSSQRCSTSTMPRACGATGSASSQQRRRRVQRRAQSSRRRVALRRRRSATAPARAGAVDAAARRRAALQRLTTRRRRRYSASGRSTRRRAACTARCSRGGCNCRSTSSVMRFSTRSKVRSAFLLFARILLFAHI